MYSLRKKPSLHFLFFQNAIFKITVIFKLFQLEEFVLCKVFLILKLVKSPRLNPLFIIYATRFKCHKL
jgi:hypothetical protein